MYSFGFLMVTKSLSNKARKAVESNNVMNFVSIASLWETAEAEVQKDFQ